MVDQQEMEKFKFELKTECRGILYSVFFKIVKKKPNN